MDQPVLERIQAVLANAVVKPCSETATGIATARKNDEKLGDTRHPEATELVTEARGAPRPVANVPVTILPAAPRAHADGEVEARDGRQ